MTNGKIKGLGNSWFIRCVPDFLERYPTYEAMAQAWRDGTLTTDLAGQNPDGWNRPGTPLNDETLLKDSTAALYGKGADAVPDEILAAIRPLITAAKNSADVRARFATGSYVGTDEYAQTLYFDFSPKQMFIYSKDQANVFYLFIGLFEANIAPCIIGNPDSTEQAAVSFSRIDIFGTNFVNIYGNYINISGQVYKYVALG